MNTTQKGACYGAVLSLPIAFMLTMSLAALVQHRGGGGHA